MADKLVVTHRNVRRGLQYLREQPDTDDNTIEWFDEFNRCTWAMSIAVGHIEGDETGPQVAEFLSGKMKKGDIPGTVTVNPTRVTLALLTYARDTPRQIIKGLEEFEEQVAGRLYDGAETSVIREAIELVKKYLNP